ncbi:MAG: head-tail adaptor protein [Alphaproteobacteria bacterium]|nr:head-tail adaptor protein [Rickettsiales bacterium]
MASNLLGLLNKKINLYSITEVSDEFGAIAKTKTNLATVWAFASILSDKQWLDFGKKNNAVIYKITIRLFQDIKVGHFAEYDKRMMLIISVKHDDKDLFITEIIVEDRQEALS